MQTISNLPSQDIYVRQLTLEDPAAVAGAYIVANAAVIASFKPQGVGATASSWGPDILLPPQSNNVVGLTGMRFKSAVAGVPAQVIGVLYDKDDPLPGAPTPFTATLSSTGSLTPAVATVQVEHNDVLVGTEAAVDFEDGGNVTWTVTDDPVFGRVKIAATVPSIPAVPTYSAQGSAFPAPSIVGETFWLNRGNAMIPFVWTGGNWFSPNFSDGDVLPQAGVSQTDVGAAQFIGPSGGGAIIDPVDAFAAGCSLQIRLLAYMQGSSAKQAHGQLGLDGVGNVVGTDVATVTGGGAAELLASAWVGVSPTFGVTRLLGYGYRDSGGAGITVSFINFTGQWRFVK